MDKKYEPTQEWIDGQKDIPEFWKGGLEDIEEILQRVKSGRVSLGCKSAGGRNVWMVEYGERNDLHRTANYSSATCVNGKNIDCYADKKREGVKPCLFLIGGVHGAEFEGTVSLLNLIQLLETGKDFRGEEHPLLVELAKNMHLIIVPCANPDGRARFPFKSVVGLPFDTFRYYNQGTWKNGELCGWPGCKQCHPIMDYADFLGCYFNDDGVNIQQDSLLPMAQETRFLMETAHEFAPDILMNIHGATDNPFHIIDSDVMPQKLRDETVRLENRVCAAFAKENYVYSLNPKSTKTDRNFFGIGLTAVLHLCCGGISLTFESNQGVCAHPGKPRYTVLGHEDIYKSHLIMYKELFQYTREIFEKRCTE